MISYLLREITPALYNARKIVDIQLHDEITCSMPTLFPESHCSKTPQL